MIKKMLFVAIGALVLSGCGSTVDNAISDAVNGDTTVEDIKAKSKVLIVTGVSTTSCAIVAIGVKDKYPNGKTLVQDSSVDCDTYSKGDDSCKIQTLDDVKAEYNNDDVNKIKAGDKNCVVGGDTAS